MPKLPYASVTLDIDTGTRPAPLKPRSEVPFRMLLMGDFSGRANRGEPSPDRLRPCLIDRDNFDIVLARMRPELELGPHGRGMVLRFRELEDFHPDRIFERHDLFSKLRDNRSAPILGVPAPPPSAPPPSAPSPRISPPANLLDNIMDAAESGPAAPSRQPDALRDFIDRAVAPHLAPREDPRLPQAVADVDRTTGELMRALLHHADFQALEAAWRSVDWLVRRLETGALLKVYVLDISKADLSASLPQLRHLLVEQSATPGAEPWALAVGNYSFGRSETDVRLLGHLARIMQEAGAPFVAEGDPGAASERDAGLWDELRHSPAAPSLGLALPRFLLRLPYGEETDTLESFAFEEMPLSVHRHYSWGSPAFACAFLLGEAFSSAGWDLRPGTYQEITGLPLHVYEEDGETQIKPCAEMLMTERDAESLIEQGYMPLVSVKNQDAVRLVRSQAIADPPAPLAGRWT